jgi:hypothetical protein
MRLIVSVDGDTSKIGVKLGTNSVGRSEDALS